MWKRGDIVVYRHRGIDGRYLFGLAVTIVEHTIDTLVAYAPIGAGMSRPVLADGSDLRSVPLTELWSHPRVAERTTFKGSTVVFVFPPRRAHSIWVFNGPAAVGWYVQLEDPHTLGERTISSRDHLLDVWVPRSSGEPQWKDEDELEAAVAVGRIGDDRAGAIRAEGERVIRERPWPTGWEAFEPDPSWPTPTLFGGWDVP